jgi:hypothetical protein
MTTNIKSRFDKLEDQTDRTGGGDFAYEVPAAGKCTARFVEYIELGKQPQRPFQGKPKAPAEEVRLTFELIGKTRGKTVQINGVDTFIPERFTLTLVKSMNKKAKFAKLFDKMLYGRDGFHHLGQLLGEGFTLEIHHVQKDDKTYANITDAAGDFTIGSPMYFNGVESVPINIPPAKLPIRTFVFTDPRKDEWDALFIDGSRDEKDDKGQIKQVSKNYLQEKIRKATNFHGSALEALLEGSNELASLDDEILETNEFDDFEEEVPTAPVKPKATKAATKKPVDISDDPLADLGM